MFGIVYRITKNVPPASFLENACIEIGKGSGSDDQKDAVEVGALEIPLFPGNPSRARPLSYRGVGLRGNDVDLRARVQQSGDFGLGYPPCAHDQAPAALQLYKHRKQA